MPLKDPNRLPSRAGLVPLIRLLRKEPGFENRVTPIGREIVITYSMADFFEFLYDRSFEITAQWEINTPPFEEMIPHLSPSMTESLQRIAKEEQMGYTCGDLASDLDRCPTGKQIKSAWEEFLTMEWRDFLIDDLNDTISRGGVSPRWFNLDFVRNTNNQTIGVKIQLSETDKELFHHIKTHGLASAIRQGLDIQDQDEDLFERWELAWQDSEHMAYLTERFEPHITTVLQGLYRPRYKHDFRQGELRGILY